jgi:hypothetical protein
MWGVLVFVAGLLLGAARIPAMAPAVGEVVLFIPEKLGLVSGWASGDPFEIDAPDGSLVRSLLRGKYLVYSSVERTPVCDIELISETTAERVVARITVEHHADSETYLSPSSLWEPGTPVYEFRVKEEGPYRISVKYRNSQIRAGTTFRMVLDVSFRNTIRLVLSALAQGGILVALIWAVGYLFERRQIRLEAETHSAKRQQWEDWIGRLKEDSPNVSDQEE